MQDCTARASAIRAMTKKCEGITEASRCCQQPSASSGRRAGAIHYPPGLRSISSTGRALVAVSDPVRTPVRTPEQPTEPITLERGPDGVARGGWWNAIGRGVVGLVLVGAAVTPAVPTRPANLCAASPP